MDALICRRVIATSLLLFSAAACSFTGASPTSSIDRGGTSSLLPPDVHRLGSVRIATEAESEGAISAEEAVNASRATTDAAWGEPEAYLVVLTDSGSLVGDKPINGTVVWLLRWDQLALDFGRPQTEDGIRPSRDPYQFAYVVVDAHSAEVLSTTLME